MRWVCSQAPPGSEGPISLNNLLVEPEAFDLVVRERFYGETAGVVAAMGATAAFFIQDALHRELMIEAQERGAGVLPYGEDVRAADRCELEHAER